MAGGSENTHKYWVITLYNGKIYTYSTVVKTFVRISISLIRVLILIQGQAVGVL